MPDQAADATTLMASMMAKEFFVIENKVLCDPPMLRSKLKEHLEYLIGIEKSGTLFASGPLFDRHGQMTGDGITIVRAQSFEEAEALASADPFVVAKLRSPTVRRWVVNEGRITVSVDLSDQRGSLS
jgi:uncharacterized protein YciI